jgi:hypothetical protein
LNTAVSYWREIVLRWWDIVLRCQNATPAANAATTAKMKTTIVAPRFLLVTRR